MRPDRERTTIGYDDAGGSGYSRTQEVGELMTVVLIIAGVLLGAILDEFSGAIFGGLIAWLAARQMKLQASINSLKLLLERTDDLPTRDQEMATTPQPETTAASATIADTVEPDLPKAHHYTEATASDTDAVTASDDEPMIGWQVPSKPDQQTPTEPGPIES